MICTYCGQETEPHARWHERGDCPPTPGSCCGHDVSDHFMGACLVAGCPCKAFSLLPRCEQLQKAVDEWCDAGDAYIEARTARSEQRCIPLSAFPMSFDRWLDALFAKDKTFDDAYARFSRAWDVITALRSPKGPHESTHHTADRPALLSGSSEGGSGGWAGEDEQAPA